MSLAKNTSLHVKQNIKNTILIVAGVLLTACGLNGFLIPNGIIDGGVVGLAILGSTVFGISTPILFFILNSPFILLGYFQIGLPFAIRTFLTVSSLTIVLLTIPFPIVTSDKLLVAVFGGIFIGAGIGLTIRGNSMLDGADVLALFVSRKISWPIGDVILIINILLFLIAAIVLNIQTALYSILTYISATKMVDFVIQGIEEYTGVMIISEKSEEIRHAILQTLKRGVTIYKGQRGFGTADIKRDEIDIIFTVITRLEISKLKTILERIDDSAFMVMYPVSDIRGGVVKKRALHQ